MCAESKIAHRATQGQHLRTNKPKQSHTLQGKNRHVAKSSRAAKPECLRSELHDLDGPAPHWIIPAARTKNKLAEHAVPLSPAAVRLIGEALNASKDEALDASKEEARGTNDQAVFAGRFEGVETLARHSLSQAVRRIVTDNKLAAFTPHDLRRTGATLAQAARLPVDFIKALLNHNDKGVARWHMLEEKREAVIAIEAAVLPFMPKQTLMANHSARL
jgi:integrase